MSYSLRRVLAVRFSVTMLVALTLIALWAFLGADRTLRSQTDTALRSAEELVAATLAAGGSLPAIREPGGVEEFVARINRFMAARDTAGHVIQANTPLAAELPLDRAAFTRARTGDTAWISQPWRGGRIRSFYAPAPAGAPGGTAVIQAAASLAPLEAASREMLFLLFGTVLLGVTATGIGASWLAKSAVAPVLEVAAQARGIKPDTRGHRITAHADVAEYEGLVEVLNDLLDRCEAAFIAQRRFIGDVGHELRTPLTALRGQMEVALRSERTPRDYQLVLRDSLEEIEHLARMSESLMLITQAEGRTLPLHRAEVDLNAVTQAVMDRRHRQIEERGLTVDVQLHYGGAPPLLDQGLVTRVLEELLDNAIKFSRQGGRMGIGTGTVNGGVQWWVEDSGPGIDPDELPRLFEPFYRLDPARSRDHGAGLGLTLAASITRLHGGTIRAAPLAGRGARFELEFPAAEHP